MVSYITEALTNYVFCLRGDGGRISVLQCNIFVPVERNWHSTKSGQGLQGVVGRGRGSVSTSAYTLAELNQHALGKKKEGDWGCVSECVFERQAGRAVRSPPRVLSALYERSS